MRGQVEACVQVERDLTQTCVCDTAVNRGVSRSLSGTPPLPRSRSLTLVTADFVGA